MKQVFQDLNKGIQRIDKVPTPNINKNQVLIQTRCSLISSGTEGMLISFGKSNYINKAKQQPNTDDKPNVSRYGCLRDNHPVISN